MRRFSVVIALILMAASTGKAAIIYLYDFPGNPGSGLAVDQTNSQPAGATFSDFTRTNVGAAAGGNVFNSNNWNQGAGIDPTQYVAFSITGDAGFVLDLASLAFDARRSATGPLNAEVALFLNGSATSYATFDFSPNTTSGPFTFDFTDLTDSDNVTLAEFRIYGWNASGAGGQLELGNIASNGSIGAAPETVTVWPVVFIMGCSVLEARKRRRQRFL